MAIDRDLNETYVRDLIDLLRPHPHGLSRHLILASLERSRRDRGLPIPPSFEQAVQATFNQHCIESDVYRSRNMPDSGFFHTHLDSGTATWRVDTSRADFWLRTLSPHYILAQAIGRIKGVPTEQALNAVEKATDEERKTWRKNLRVKVAIAQIRAENAEKALEREGFEHGPSIG